MLSEKSRKRLISMYDQMSTSQRKTKAEVDAWDGKLAALTKEIREQEPEAFHIDITKPGQKMGTLDDRVFFDEPRFVFGNPGCIHRAKFACLPAMDMAITP